MSGEWGEPCCEMMKVVHSSAPRKKPRQLSGLGIKSG